LKYWTNLLDQASPPDVVATGIFNNTERLNPLVTQFYEQYLGRGTDPGGLAYWVADWQAKGDPRDVVENILSSPEFFDDAGGTNLGFVTLLYERVLQRPGEPRGVSYWVGLMSPPSPWPANSCVPGSPAKACSTRSFAVAVTLTRMVPFPLDTLYL
jgi:hypothetical protein